MDSSGGSKGCMGQFTTFVRTRKGIILIAEIIACLLILILFGSSGAASYGSLPIFMAIYSVIIFILFCCDLHNQLTFIHWGWTDFIRALIGAVAFIIISIVVFVNFRHGATIVGGVFGILTGILFGYDAYTILPSLKKRHTAAPTGPTDGI
ncbi:proteolipid protein 2 [Elgaria multicarinata webbii]|uniref:proteolipid protein 2 n=1 Tax=Elgaria multicarinata webbii TaxID=159646 RepID=UPI002FCCCD37